LLTREITTQNKKVQTVETRYNLQTGIPYEQQVNTCQMPREVQTSWTESDNATRYRSETVRNTYDNHGNLLTHTRADGIVESTTWFPAAGGDGCPADPEGFVRCMKDKTLTPAPSGQGGAPTLCTRYSYKALPTLPGSAVTQWLVPQSETRVQLATRPGDDEQELQVVRTEYFDVPKDPLLHGHIKHLSLTLNGQSTTTTYAYETIESPDLNVPVHQTTETLTTDFDDVRKTVVHHHSLFSGQELMTEAQGVKTFYAYDALNRLTRETVAPRTEFEACREYQYTLCANPGAGETLGLKAGIQAEQVLISARKVKTRTLLDGLGRPVREERDHVDSAIPERFKDIYSAKYTAWNTLDEETQYDWLPAPLNQTLALTSHFEYDDWGQQSCVIGPDGVQSHQTLDPIGNREGPVQRNWVQSAGMTPLISGLTEIRLNTFGKPDQVLSLDANEQPLGSQTYLYDGLGRCTKQIDELQHETLFEYDAWLRMVSSTLPDYCVVSRDYAGHSSAELPIALTVTEPDGVTRTLAGEQVFDGLGRLTQVTAGQRTEHYAYDRDRTQVKRKTTAAGESIEFEYNLLLTDQPVSSYSPDETADFSYDNTSGRLTRAKNELGVRTYEYDVHNRLSSESWIDAQDAAWQTLYVSSLAGRQLKRTELRTFKLGTSKLGTTKLKTTELKKTEHEKDAGAGLDTLYHYDSMGRVERIEQGNLLALVGYNTLSQVNRIITQNVAAGTQLVTELEYDEQGREILRSLHLDGHPSQSLEQAWRADGLLERRHLKAGGADVLEETFNYDNRGRLQKHICSGTRLPTDSLGRKITQQIFSFDTLDNLVITVTDFNDGQNERAIFKYREDDPCQLKEILYTPSRATPDPTFAYDDNGNQLNDQDGQLLNYDSQSRLTFAMVPIDQTYTEYGYDSHDHLVTSQYETGSATLRFYQGQQLSCTVQDDQQTRYCYLGDQPLGQQQAGDASTTLLLLTDPNHSVLGESQHTDPTHSVLGESQQDKLRMAVYSAYGERHSDDDLLSTLAFNGEVRESRSGWYLLGKGYRAYNPTLMRFHSPDSLSPFGAGGINPYTYCLGNPIALRDPTGHDASGWTGRPRKPDEDYLPALSGGGSGWEAWFMVGVGVVMTAVGVYATVATFGLASPVTAPLTALGMSTATTGAIGTGLLATSAALTAGATAASAVATANGDETASKISFYMSIAAGVTGAAGSGFISATRSAFKAAKAGAALSAADSAATAPAPLTAASAGNTAAASSASSGSRASSVASAAAASVPEPPALPTPLAATVQSTNAATTAGMRPSAAALEQAKKMLKPTRQVAAGVVDKGSDEFLAAIAARAKGKSVGVAVAQGRQAGNTSAFLTTTTVENIRIRNIRG
jgi:RHS repeat-associated protein